MSTPANEIGNETLEYPGTVSPVEVSMSDAVTHVDGEMDDSMSMKPRLKSLMSSALNTGLTQSPGAP